MFRYVDEDTEKQWENYRQATDGQKDTLDWHEYREAVYGFLGKLIWKLYRKLNQFLALLQKT